MKGGIKMHRRDYILIAKTIKGIEFENPKSKEVIISAVCKSLKTENSSFNEQKFRDYIEKGE
jgi:hypothetical protein